MFKPKLFLRPRIILSFALIGIFYIVFSNIGQYTNDAHFGGDDFGYQSMAVNFAKGHGMQKFGGLEKFDEYKFDKLDTSLINYFNENAGWDFFYRPPAYPLFLGVIYKIFGVHPIIAKHIQLLLLIIIASALPLIGFYYWKNIGFISGLIAGPLYLSFNYKFSEYILTESLISFSVFLVVISFIYAEYKKYNILSSVILGMTIGFCLLVKGGFMFIPILIGIYLLYKFYKKRDKKLLLSLAVFTLVCLFTVLPWCLYASMKSHSIVFVSTQGDAILLNTNNEYCNNGIWYPEWKDKKESFYNNDNMEGKPGIIRVLNFYEHHPNLILKILEKKLVQSYNYFLFFWIIIILFIIEALLIFFRKYFSGLYIYLCMLAFPLLILFVTYWIMFLGQDYHHILQAFSNNPSVMKLEGWAIGLSAIFIVFLMRKHYFLLKIPSVFYILFLNFFLVSFIIGADHAVYASRYVRVMDFVFVLIAVVYSINLISFLIKTLANGYNT